MGPAFEASSVEDALSLWFIITTWVFGPGVRGQEIFEAFGSMLCLCLRRIVPAAIPTVSTAMTRRVMSIFVLSLDILECD